MLTIIPDDEAKSRSRAAADGQVSAATWPAWYPAVLRSIAKSPAAAGRVAVVILLSLGIVGRLAWIVMRGSALGGGEAQNVAIAFARGHGLADAYFPGSGPTAHLLPTTPFLAGLVYGWLGVLTPAAEAVLQVVAFVEIGIAWLLLLRVMGLLGVPLVARLSALAALSLIPVFVGNETLDFRYWEGGLAVMLGAAGLNHIIDLARSGTPASSRSVIIAGALFAVTFMVTPPVGLGIGLGYFLLFVRPFSWRRVLLAGVSVAVALTVVLGPWVLRNERVFGAFVPLRSNAPLELSIANNEPMLTMSPEDAFHRQAWLVHPSARGRGAERYVAMGEIAYMQAVKDETNAWIARHPAAFAGLCLRHLRQMFFPDAWQFNIGSGKLIRERAWFYTIVSLLGLIGLGWRLVRGDRGWGYVALAVAAVAVIYAPFQPMSRYLYLNYAILLFCAADFVVRLVGAGRRTAVGGAPDAATR